jgi:hypothetical protein
MAEEEKNNYQWKPAKKLPQRVGNTANLRLLNQEVVRIAFA